MLISRTSDGGDGGEGVVTQPPLEPPPAMSPASLPSTRWLQDLGGHVARAASRASHGALSGPSSSNLDREEGFLHPARWQIRFADGRNGGDWYEGFLHSYSPTCWTTMIDQDDDILTVRHLK